MKKFRGPNRSRARQRQADVKRKHLAGFDGASSSKERSVGQLPPNDYHICPTSQKGAFEAFSRKMNFNIWFKVRHPESVSQSANKQGQTSI